ncbi:GIY-YIG nuclease family protein [Gelidibacter pelagius]|uniref:GIY-YIG nuclease family protein n=1 Tax=Gelidibacter pelagius TaxID=2819985 RepID=A0ABS3SY84_9FLAO|nr:GIY-YIG nuclease family protein [Gelidibacter pelagius]MBO3100236.1 GIY-YIG nuclease family protein [Gelidibacter pelagius]
MKPGFIYILTNKNNTTLYVGVTSAIVIRVKQHKEKYDPKSFTAKYSLDKLVYYEAFQMIGDAIGREKQLKAGSRAKKVALIESINPDWMDLYEEVKEMFGDCEDAI